MPVGHLRDLKSRGDILREYSLDMACHFSTTILDSLIKSEHNRLEIASDMRKTLPQETRNKLNSVYEGFFSGYCGFNDWKNISPSIESKLADRDAWWNRGEYRDYVKRTHDFLNHVKNIDVRKEISSRFPGVGVIENSIHLYAELISKWPLLTDAILRLRNENIDIKENGTDKEIEEALKEVGYDIDREILTILDGIKLGNGIDDDISQILAEM